MNNVVLVNGVPETLGLYDLCRHYIDHRLDVVVAAPNTASNEPRTASTSSRASSSPSTTSTWWSDHPRLRRRR